MEKKWILHRGTDYEDGISIDSHGVTFYRDGSPDREDSGAYTMSFRDFKAGRYRGSIPAVIKNEILEYIKSF